MADDPRAQLKVILLRKWETAIDDLMEDMDDEMEAAGVPRRERRTVVRDAIDSDVADQFIDWEDEYDMDGPGEVKEESGA